MIESLFPHSVNPIGHYQDPDYALCDLRLCYKINVLVPATLARYLWPRVKCSKAARLGNQLDLGKLTLGQ